MVTRLIAPWAELVPGVEREITAAELLAWPDDGWQYELVEGRLVRMPPTMRGHGRTLMALLLLIGRHVEDNNLGLTTPPDEGFLLSRPGQKDIVLAPDIAFIRAERLSQLPQGEESWRKYSALAPDLVVEIASPSQYRPEMAAKARLYLELGVRLVWVFWPRQKRVDVWRPGSDQPVATLGVDDTLSGEDVLPGFTLPLAQLFV
jgi:Uma2 family endonuclease